MPKKQQRKLIWKRALAFLVDIIIIQFIVNLSFNKLIKQQLNIEGSFFEIYSTLSSNYQQLTPFFTYISIITAVIAIIYFTIFEFKMEQTLGKMLFNIKVTAFRGKLNLQQAFIRNIPKALFFINVLFWILILDVVYMLFKKERLFDILAKTRIKLTTRQ